MEGGRESSEDRGPLLRGPAPEMQEHERMFTAPSLGDVQVDSFDGHFHRGIPPFRCACVSTRRSHRLKRLNPETRRSHASATGFEEAAFGFLWKRPTSAVSSDSCMSSHGYAASTSSIVSAPTTSGGAIPRSAA